MNCLLLQIASDVFMHERAIYQSNSIQNMFNTLILLKKKKTNDY